MIVLDASAMTSMLASDAQSERIQRALEHDADWVVPEHFRLEVVNAIRRRVLRRELPPTALLEAMGELQTLGVDVWPTVPLLPRIVQLAPNATSYDAAYIALAEELGAPLVTADAKLAGLPGIRCTVLGP